MAGGEAVVAPSVTRRLIDAFAGCLPDPAGASVREEARNAQLTARERELLVEVASGRSNGEIAQCLGVGPGTVKTHVAPTLAKVACATGCTSWCLHTSTDWFAQATDVGRRLPASPESIDRPDGTGYPAGAVRVER